jgi:hypothetical protein
MKTKESQMRPKSTGSKLNQIMAELKEKHSLNSVPVPVTQTITPYKLMPVKEIVISPPLSENSLKITPIIEALNRELSNDSLNSSPNSLRIAESPINLREKKTREEPEEVIIDDEEEEEEKSRTGAIITPVIIEEKTKDVLSNKLCNNSTLISFNSNENKVITIFSSNSPQIQLNRELSPKSSEKSINFVSFLLF